MAISLKGFFNRLVKKSAGFFFEAAFFSSTDRGRNGPLPVRILFICLLVVFDLSGLRAETEFLLPLPDDLGSDVKSSMIPFYASPSVDMEMIMAMADRFEKETRSVLIQRRKKLTADFCAATPESRLPLLQSYTESAGRQMEIWHRVRDLYEKNLEGLLGNAWNTDLRQKRGLAIRMQEERQITVLRSWEALFLAMERSGPDCLNDLAPVAEALPPELMFAPYYLAQFRFLTALPLDLRLKVILQFER